MDVAVGYSEKQVDMIMESAKTLLPVTTAYLALAAATAKYMFEARRIALTRQIVALSAVFVFGLASLAAWIVSISGVVDSSRAFKLPGTAIPEIAYLRTAWKLAVHGQQVAVISFFVSVFLYCTLLLYTFVLNRQQTADDLDET